MGSIYARACTEGPAFKWGVETRPALYPRFCADGLQVVVTDGRKGTVRVIW
jgi:hypothetical protein